MVTAETALAVPAVVLVLALCLSVVHLGIDRVRCVDAARVAVRELARGEPPGSATAHARRVAPDGATIESVVSGRDVTVTVRAPAPGAAAWVTGSTTCRSSARLERSGDA